MEKSETQLPDPKSCEIVDIVRLHSLCRSKFGIGVLVIVAWNSLVFQILVFHIQLFNVHILENFGLGFDSGFINCGCTERVDSCYATSWHLATRLMLELW